MTDATEIDRLAHELEEAELYELRLRACIVAIRDELAAVPEITLTATLRQ
jgi:hypothetical protein